MQRLRRKKKRRKGMEEQLASYADYLFEAPDWKLSILGIVCLAIVAGIVSFPGAWGTDVLQGVVILGVPAVLSAFLTKPLSEVFGKKMSYNRSALVALSSLFIISLISLITGLIAYATNTPYNYTILALCLSLVFALRLLILLGISINSFPKVLVPASIHTVFSGLLLAYFLQSSQVTFALAVSSVIFVSAAAIFVKFVDYPMVKSFGVSSFDFVQDFIAHISEGSPEMEEFFDKIGESIDAPISVVAFKRPDGSDKALIITPYVHPGPMGEIGGGNLPAIIASAFPDKTVLVPHGTASHDFNLVTADESQKVIEAARKALARIEYSTTASRSIRETVDDCHVLGQRFGDSVFLVSTRAPMTTDDIEFSVGFTAMAEARVAGSRAATIIDAHNCMEPLASPIEPGSRDSYNIIRACANASKRLLSTETVPLRVGVASSPPICTRLEGMGDLGIRVAVVETQGQRTAYVVIDGNNMVTGLREKIIEKLPVDDAEVMTTDTHVVNTLSPVNYVGQNMDREVLVAKIAELVDKAIADLEPVSVGMEIEIAENLRVFGSHKIAKLASTANAMVAMAGAFAGAVIVAALSLTILILSFVKFQ